MSIPAPAAPEDVTQLLLKWRSGDGDAFDRLIAVVYGELRRMAHRHLRREPADCTMQTTALVHEAYVRLVKAEQVNWQSRVHFYRVTAKAMRQVLVDEARRRRRQKRGAEWTRATFDEALTIGGRPDLDLVALDQALEWLRELAPRKSEVVELRFFGGLSIKETAEALEVSTDTVKSDWATAKLWLLRRLTGQDGEGAERKGTCHGPRSV